MTHEERKKILVKDLNSVITCRLCEGYLIDATTLIDCLHYFCRGCILRYFENNKTGCPTCNTVLKKKTQQCFRPDPQIQSLVYKLVPSLYAKEIQRREDFYRSTGVRASSSCSDDSVIDRERDMINEQEKMISKCVGDKTQFLSPDDSISLSLEYYQIHLDTTSAKDKRRIPQVFVAPCENVSVPKDTTSESTVQTSDNCSPDPDKKEKTDPTSDNVSDNKTDKDNNNSNSVVNSKEDNSTKCDNKENKDCDKRFLQCPAAVSMKHLQKFVRMKFGLTMDHRVDIIYKGEVLPVDFSLMDVAYTFSWKRVKPMRFFYRIFTPLKIKPFKIINTALSTGGKQLQVVPLKPNVEPTKVIESEPEKVSKKEEEEDCKEKTTEQQIEKDKLMEKENTEDKKKELFAHLQLKSKSPPENKETVQRVNSCLYDYEEPDQEEIKKFAENRDREWALQKKLDESRKKEEEDEFNSHHFTKKRKKSKHSKNEFNVHKKRKLHAEIASNEEDLKLKVKITNNGHKHKHHKSSGQSGKMQNSDCSSKEKLLQMRQIRHKGLFGEDKIIQAGPSLNSPNDTNPEKITVDVTSNSAKPEKEESKHPQVDDVKKLKIKVPEPSTKVTESAVLPKQQTESTNTSPKIGTFPEPTASKSPVKTTVDKDANKKVPTVHIERNEQTEKHAQKTFLKTFPTNPEKHKIEKILNKPETATTSTTQMKTINFNKPPMKTDIKSDLSKMHVNKLLERKIASLQTQCTIEPKQEKKINSVAEKLKNNFVTPHYPPGFTVSKIEQGVKRKIDDQDPLQDKRPSLEITLINPPTSPIYTNSKPAEKHLTLKRPPPATIPLEKIKKSVNLKSGISIIPKLPERCDNIGALDLSKPSKSPDIVPKNSPRTDSSFTLTTNRQLNALSRIPNAPTEKNMGLSNLQMLSKVATEHSSSNSKPNQINSLGLNKPKPQIPNLQTLKIPLPQNQIQKNPNIQRMPKLNEIQKFRPTNLQIRNMRPNPNQNIRNIPNPSLLNQNRLHSQIMQQNNLDNTNSKASTPISTTSTSNTSATSSSSSVSKEPPTIKILESKIQEKKEILV